MGASATQLNHQHQRERKTGTVCAPIASQLMKTASNAIRSNSTQLNQQQVDDILFYLKSNIFNLCICYSFHMRVCACVQQQNQKSVNKTSSHNNAGSAENQQPQIGDNNHLQNLSKTGSFLSHLAREFSGGRASSSSAASDLPAMKSTSRKNSSGSNNSSSGVAGKRVMRKQQHSCSEGSVCEEAREHDETQSTSTTNEPPATATVATLESSTNETSNENDTKTVRTIDWKTNFYYEMTKLFILLFVFAVKRWSLGHNKLSIK